MVPTGAEGGIIVIPKLLQGGGEWERTVMIRMVLLTSTQRNDDLCADLGGLRGCLASFLKSHI